MTDYGEIERAGEPFKPGEIAFEKFEVIRKIGEGGMGFVFEVRDINLDKRMALKVLTQSNDDSLLIRFQNEARTSSRLSHPNIATVFDFGIKGASPYLAIELITGTTLHDCVSKNGCLTLSQFFDVFDDVCAALECAHQQTIIHRDLKPGNIMISQNTDGIMHACLVDFGLAKRVDIDEKDAASLTITGQLLGTPLYMSPEQATGEPATKAADLYALGCVMFFSLKGAAPFRGKTIVETLAHHKRTPPPELTHDFRREPIPMEIGDLVARLLSKAPEDRYDTAARVRSELSAIHEVLVARDIATTAATAVALDVTASDVTASAVNENKVIPGKTTSTSRWALTGIAVFCLAIGLVVLNAIREVKMPTNVSQSQLQDLGIPEGSAADEEFERIKNVSVSRHHSKYGFSRPHIIKDAEASFSNGNIERAMEDYKEAILDSDVNAKIEGNLGLLQCYLYLHKPEYLHFERECNKLLLNFDARERPERQTQLMMKIGDLYSDYDKPQRAKSCYLQAIELNKKTGVLESEELARASAASN